MCGKVQANRIHARPLAANQLIVSFPDQTERVMTTLPSLVTIPDTELRMLSSPIVGQEFSICVALPHTYSKDSSNAYPVIYVPDANASFGIVTETVRWLTFFNDIPEVIVVGIGYPVRSFKEAQGLRTRDLTPTETDWYETWWKPRLSDAPADAGSGGAANFLRFSREELIPFVDTNYRTLPGDNTLMGFSLGGLFALYTLFIQPDTFRSYVVGSPSVWWDDEMILSLEKDFAAQHSDLPAKVFLSVAGNEEAAMIANMYQVTDVLRSRQYKSIEIVTHFFEGETHMSNTAAFVSWGLRAAFTQKA
jgi:predicted alpha/beta superfamily hydrolase